MQDPGWASSFCRHSASPVQLCMNAPVPHRFLEFCKENGGYTGCPFPAKLDLQQGAVILINEELSYAQRVYVAY